MLDEFQVDEIGIHDDMDKPIRMPINVSVKRINYYDDVIDHMKAAAITRYVKLTNTQPSEIQLHHLTASLARTLVIDRDPLAAQNVNIT